MQKQISLHAVHRDDRIEYVESSGISNDSNKTSPSLIFLHQNAIIPYIIN